MADAGTGESGLGEYPVFTGVWTKWSKGRILGATLTLTRTDAHLLIAFAAVFTALVGVKLWRIICLGIHFSLSTDKPEDALHHQRQTLLRNAADPEAGFVTFSSLAWTWKGRGMNTATRLGGLILLGAFWFFGFVFLGGSTSLIANTEGTDVLLVGDRCSVKAVDLPANLSPDDLDDVKTYEASRVIDAANTASRCSRTLKRNRAACNSFAVNQMPLAVRNLTASCPFDSDICLSTNGNILLDTGVVDSREHLGINSPTKQKFGYRRRLHCAPIKTDGYEQDFSVAGERRPMTRYFYGRQWDAAREAPFTYEYQNHLSNTTGRMTPLDYTVGVRQARRRNGVILEDQSSVDPIDDLLLEDADVVLIFLSANDIMYPRNHSDPWYRITTSVSGNNASTTRPSTGFFVQSTAASPLACAVREQWCNPNKELLDPTRCGPLSSAADALEGAVESRVFDDMPGARTLLDWVVRAGWSSPGVSDVGDIVKALGSQALGARQLLSDGVGSLAENQWMLDVQHWHETAMVSMQESMVHAVVGPPQSGASKVYSLRPQADEEFELCQSQMVHSIRHQSFSILGLSLLFGIGVLIYVLSYALEPILGYLAAKFGIQKYQYQEWCAGDPLQMQRLAHEEAGDSFWTYARGVVKLTSMVDVDKGPAVASLDMTDPKRPWLKRTSRYTWDPDTGTFSLRSEFQVRDNRARRWSPVT